MRAAFTRAIIIAPRLGMKSYLLSGTLVDNFEAWARE